MEIIMILLIYVFVGFVVSAGLCGKLDAPTISAWPFVIIGVLALHLYEYDELRKEKKEEDDQWME